jgi:type IV pilus assembly protein PilM
MALKRSSVGVDIGHANIRIVQAEKTTTGFKITKFAHAETPKDAIRDGQITQPELIGHAIKHAMKEAHIHANSAVVAAAGGAVFIRTVQFPKMTAQMLRESVKFEAGRYVPGSVEDSYVEAEILGLHGESQMDVLLVAAPKDSVGARMSACAIAGMEVEVVETETFAAYRAVLEHDPSREVDQKTYMLVNIGAANTFVSVIEKGVYIMHRSMPNAGNMLTDALRQAFKLEQVDAEAGKSVLDLHELLTSGSTENPPLKVIATMVDDIIRELRRSLNFLQTQGQQREGAKETQIDAVILCGGGAKLKGMAAYMETKLGIPVQALGIFDNPFITHSIPVNGNGIDLAVAAGLAMRSHLKAA